MSDPKNDRSESDITNKLGAHYSVQHVDILRILAEKFSLERNLRFLDLTFGHGGHSLQILNQYPNSIGIGFDQDPEAYQNGKIILEKKQLDNRYQIFHSNFQDYQRVLKQNGIDSKFNIILADLGVSSHHFDSGDRGFSFRYDSRLDMRMDISSSSQTAYDIVNELDEESLANLIFKFGEEHFSRRIAREIVEAREQKPILTTFELAEICRRSYPNTKKRSKIHPATKTFQAIRIAVNNELGVLENCLETIVDCLDPSGLLFIISFHSLEDRIVKEKFRSLEKSEAIKLYRRKAIKPGREEIEENPRSRSAKLRVLEKIK